MGTLFQQLQYKESLAQQQARYNAELAALRDQLQETDAMRNVLNREVSIIIKFMTRSLIRSSQH